MILSRFSQRNQSETEATPLLIYLKKKGKNKLLLIRYFGLEENMGTVTVHISPCVVA